MGAEQPGQPGQCLAVRRVRHQRHRDHQPDHQRIGHDPPSLPLLPQPFASAAPAIASITPSPRCRSSSPSRTKSGSHPSASTLPPLPVTTGAATTGRQNTASSPRAGAAPPAVTIVRVLASLRPAPGRPRRNPGNRGPRCPACINEGMQIRKHKGSWTDVDSTPNAYQEPLPQANTPNPSCGPANPRSQPHINRQALKSVVLWPDRHRDPHRHGVLCLWPDTAADALLRWLRHPPPGAPVRNRRA